ETLGGNQLDLSDMTHLRLDYWTANMDPFKVKLVDFGANGQYAGGDDSESELSFQPIAQTWNTLEIPLSQFSNLNSLSHFSQLILSGEPVGTGVVFIDNVLFFDENLTHTTVHEAQLMEVYPSPFDEVLHIKSQENISAVVIQNILGQHLMTLSFEQNEVEIPTSHLPYGMYVVQVHTQNGGLQQVKILKK
ncbi:MAG: T9SS type A sorting domain-containing protein, partial [Flavobacteriia bacterium]